MSASPPKVVSVTRSPAFTREAMIHMHELYSSSPSGGDVRSYAPRLTITDLRGNQSVINGAAFAVDEHFNLQGRPSVLINDLGYASPLARSASAIAINAAVNVRFKPELGGPLAAPGRVVVAHVLKRVVGSDTWTVSAAPDVAGAQLVPGFDINGTAGVFPYSSLPGDFLLSTLTDSSGDASFSFTHSGLSAGDEVRISIVAVLEPSVGFANPTFELLSVFDWDLPRTQSGPTPTVPSAKDLRGLTTVF